MDGVDSRDECARSEASGQAMQRGEQQQRSERVEERVLEQRSGRVVPPQRAVELMGQRRERYPARRKRLRERVRERPAER
jgi:hypothetical protein